MVTQIINGKLKIRHDTAVNWAAENPVLLAGELGLVSDTRNGKFGDGVTAWNNLKYAFQGNNNRSVEFIRTTNAAVSASLTGISEDDALYDGKTIFLYLTYAAAENATLNLTLANGSTTGAKPVFITSTTRLGNQYDVSSVVSLTYISTLDGWYRADSISNVISNTDRHLHNDNILAASAIVSNTIIVGDAEGYKQAASGVTFDIAYPILFASKAIAAAASSKDTYDIYPSVPVSTTVANWTGIQNSMLFLVGTISGTTFTIDSSVFTTTIPSTEDGKVYLPIGICSTTTSVNFYPQSILFAYTSGSFKQYGFITAEAGTSNGQIKINGTDVTVYTHPTSSGYKHIPTGGLSGQLLKYSADGTATWATITPSDIGAASSSIDTGVMSVTTGSTNGTILVDGTSVAIKGLDSAAYTKSSDYATAGHTHSYAGSSSVGGAATSANKINTDAGSATQPVYFSNGIPVATTYTLGKSVPSDAVFTDTNNAVTNTLGTTTKFYVTGTTSSTTNTGGQTFDTGVYVSTTAGELVATKFTGPLNGNANTASKINTSVKIGDTNKPVYVAADGTVTALSYTIDKSVPSNAVFTDTNNAVTNTLGNTTKFYVTGTTSAATNTGGQVFDTSVYVSTTAGELVATKFTGALNGTADNASKLGNVAASSYALKSDLPTSVSDLTNDSGFITGVAWEDVTGKPATFEPATHTHNYAGSSSSGGAATSANKLNTDAGSTTQPVYFSNGVPVATSYSLAKSVPSNAVFTDTNNAVTNTLGTTTKFYVTGTTSATTNTGGQVFDTGVYVSTTAGELVATKFTGALNGKANDSDKLGGTAASSYALKSYVDTAVANLVDSAPETLDTLGELAALLGEDIDMSTTIATQIGSKVTTGSADYIKSASVSGKTLTLTKGNNTTVTFTEADTQYSAGSGLSLSGTTFNHASTVTAATVGTSSATSGITLAVPYVTYNATGHITATGTHIHTVSNMTAASASAAGAAGLVPAPAQGDQAKFLRADGTWQAANNYTHPSDGANTGSFGPSANASPAHGAGFSVPYISVNAAGHVTAASTKTITLPAQYTHPSDGANVGSFGPSANASPAHGATFSVPYITVNAAGHVTAASTKTITLPADSDTKVNVTLATTTKAYLLGTSTTPTATAQGVTALADTGVYLDTTAGKLTATSFAGNGAALTALNASNISSGTLAAARLATSGAAAGSYGESADKAPGYSGSFNIPYVTVDTYGRVTGIANKKITLPAADNTDTKNTAGATDTSSKIFLIGATSQAANPQTYSDNEVYATNGVLTTKSVQVGGTACTLQYNATNKCIDFVFA